MEPRDIHDSIIDESRRRYEEGRALHAVRMPPLWKQSLDRWLLERSIRAYTCHSPKYEEVPEPTWWGRLLVWLRLRKRRYRCAPPPSIIGTVSYFVTDWGRVTLIADPHVDELVFELAH